MKENFQSGWDLILRSRRIFITSHVNPDGDSIGSLLALGQALRHLGKNVTLGLQDPVPASCSFMLGSDQIDAPPIEEEFDLGILLDCEGSFRAGSLESTATGCPERLLIDHHPSNQAFEGVEIRDDSAAATGEIIFEFLKANGCEIDPEIAERLMTAIMLDTGGFRYSNVTPHTLRVAAELREIGADIPKIYRHLFEDRPRGSTQLLGLALSRLGEAASGLIHYAYLTREDFAIAGAGENETDTINIHLISIQGTEASALFRESESGGVRVSLRSRNWLDVNQAARAFGGGGHVRAAGCTLQDPIQEAIRLVLAEMEKQINGR